MFFWCNFGDAQAVSKSQVMSETWSPQAESVEFRDLYIKGLTSTLNPIKCGSFIYNSQNLWLDQILWSLCILVLILSNWYRTNVKFWIILSLEISLCFWIKWVSRLVHWTPPGNFCSEILANKLAYWKLLAQSPTLRIIYISLSPSSSLMNTRVIQRSLHLLCFLMYCLVWRHPVTVEWDSSFESLFGSAALNVLQSCSFFVSGCLAKRLKYISAFENESWQV